MRSLPVLLLTLWCTSFLLGADASAEAGIRRALDTQTKAWNRGDLTAFVKTYAPDCSYVGRQLVEGRDNVLASYRKSFPTAAMMGTLSFSLLAIRDLEPGQSAYVVGEFHLERKPSDGGPANGVFTLVFRNQNGVWLIVLDHSHGS